MSTRLEKSKFRYPVEHGAAFVELRDDTMSGEEVFQILETVPCVGRVYWQISKHAQGNKSLRPVGTPYTGVGHLLEQNVMVKSMLFRRPFEFELTRSMHTKKQGTCSITFKKALAGQLLEAWRILRRASMDRVLLSSSQEFEKWHNDICVEYSEQAILQDQALPLLAAGAGSATPGSTISAVVPASGSGVSYVTLGSEDTLSCWCEQFLCFPTTPVPQAKQFGKLRHRQPLAAVPRPVSAQGNNVLQLAESAVPAIEDTLSCWSLVTFVLASAHQVIFPGLGVFHAKVLPRVVLRRGAHHFARRGEQFLCLPTTPVPQAKGVGKSRRRQPLAAVPRPVSAQGNNVLQRWEFGTVGYRN
jgi:hypothetical protein